MVARLNPLKNVSHDTVGNQVPANGIHCNLHLDTVSDLGLHLQSDEVFTSLVLVTISNELKIQ